MSDFEKDSNASSPPPPPDNSDGRPRKRFRDVYKGAPTLDGKKKKIEEIIGKPIFVLAYRVKKSKYADKSGDCLTIQYEFEGERYVSFSGSVVLLKQLEECKDELPLEATIEKVQRDGRYFYSFT